MCIAEPGLKAVFLSLVSAMPPSIDPPRNAIHATISTSQVAAQSTTLITATATQPSSRLPSWLEPWTWAPQGDRVFLSLRHNRTQRGGVICYGRDVELHFSRVNQRLEQISRDRTWDLVWTAFGWFGPSATSPDSVAAQKQVRSTSHGVNTDADLTFPSS